MRRSCRAPAGIMRAIVLAWYYPGIAADKLGFPEASNRYPAEARRLSAQKDTACANGVILTCGGIDIARDARRSPD